MIKLLKINFFIVIFILVSYHSELYAYFEVTGIQSGIWSLDKSPYIVRSDILVPKGLVLKIEKGVIVKFAGNYQIMVGGGLIASGNKTNPIVFTSVFDNEFGKDIIKRNKIPQPSDWKGIEFLDDCDDYLTVMNYCIVRYSKWGIRCSNSYPLLTNLMLVDNEHHALNINNQEYVFEPGLKINPISQEKRASLASLPEPVEETDQEKRKRLREQQKLIIEQRRLKALQDSIRKANKIKPIFSKTGRITLEREIFDQFNVQSINELMGYLPGFLNFATIWTGNQLTSRGIAPTLSNNRLLPQINGIPFYEPIAKISCSEFIPLDALEQIEIDRGIMLSHFNQHGIIGTANFLPRYSTSGLVNKSKIELGVFGTKKLTTFLGFTRDSTFINLSTNFKNNTGYWRTLSQGEVGLNFRQKYASDLYNFSMFLKYPSLNVFTCYFEHDQFQLGLIPQLQYTSPTHRRGLVFSLKKEIKITPQLNTSIVGNYIQIYERSEISNSGADGSEELLAANYLLSKGNLLLISVLSQYKQPHYLITAGISVSRFLVQPLFEIKSKEDQNTQNGSWKIITNLSEYENSGFVGMGYDLSPFIGLDGKVYIHFPHSFNRPDFSVDAKVIYNPFLPFDSYLRYTTAIRTPTLIEKRIYLPDIFYGNANLKSEKFDQWEWCSDIHLMQDLTLGIVIYYLQDKNLIQLNSDNYFTNNNKTFWTTGYEFMLQGTLTNKIFLLSNISYNNVESSGWCYPKLKISGLTKIDWFDNFSTVVTTQYLSHLNTNVKIGPYYLVNLSLAYQLLPKIKITFNGLDLLDQRPENPEYTRGEIPAIPAGPGRSFYITMTIE